MSKDILILILSWGIAIVLLIWKVPRNKIKDAQIVFLFAQSLGWLYVFIQIYFKHIIFPIREFPEATDMLVSLHFIVYPTFCVFFVLFYPNAIERWRIVAHYIVFVLLHQSYETFIENYTHLIAFINWKTHWGISVKILVYFSVYHFYKWFTKGLKNNSS
jgi:hypothetical protein